MNLLKHRRVKNYANILLKSNLSKRKLFVQIDDI